MALQKQSYSAARFGVPSMPHQRQPRLCPLTRCSTDRQQKPYEQRRAETGTALLLFQRRPHSYPPVPPRRRYGFGAASMLFRPQPRAPPAAARKQQGKKSGELFRAASARCKCRFSGSQSMFRRRPADWRQKPASSAGPPRYRLPYQSRPCPYLCYSAKTAYKPSKRRRYTPERFPYRVSGEQRPPSLPTARKRRRN